MTRLKQQLMDLVENLSPEELEQLRGTLLSPRVKALRDEKAELERRLKEVDKEISRFESVEAPTRVGRPRGRPAKAAPAAPAAAAEKPSGRRGRPPRANTMAEKVSRVLEKVGKPLRVKEICDLLVRAGEPAKPGLVSYVNRTLSVGPQFKKSGWGLYSLAGKNAQEQPVAEAVAQPPVKRRPGRPPGSKNLKTAAKVPGRKRGRPPKQQPAPAPEEAGQPA